MPVLYKPVVFAVEHSISNNQEGMTLVRLAEFVVKNAFFVKIKIFYKMYAHSDWTYAGHCFLKGQLIARLNLGKISAGSPDFRTTKSTGSFLLKQFAIELMLHSYMYKNDDH